jgi:type I restriction-modification system DNA methylase subunit/restriction endonuclease S subunit
MNKKAPCITLTEIQQIVQIKEVKTDLKITLINVFKNCLNILRDNEGLTGEKALRTMSYLLILKLIEPHFGLGGEIDIDNYNYDFNHIEDEMVETHKNKLLSIVRFSNLSNEKEDNIPVNMKYLWNDILAVHPSTKKIFLKGKGFDIQHKSTYKKLIDKLNSVDLSDTEHDVLGNAYEEVIQDIMTGKVLGQFFTPPLVKKMMVKLIDPQIHPDGKIDTCGDPTMGTGGFLITCLDYIIQQAKNKNIKPDWGFIKTEGLYGKELEPDTYQLAVSNMLISSGHMFDQLERGDSIRDPITRKFDNILANPPFGIKGLKYDDFTSSLKTSYIPIKSDNAVSLFIQAIIYMLKINGKCAVVLPDGQDLFSKTNTTLVAVREYLMKTCDLKEIIYLPSGVFTYTSIKTCVFYFVKKREGNDVLETNIKVSKNQKETKRENVFSKTVQTKSVKFYDYNETKDEKYLLVDVPIEKIVCNSYSLNYAEYMKDETTEQQYKNDTVVKNLGDVCNIDYGTRIVKKDNTDGEYPVYGSGRATFTTNTYNREGYNILIGRFALSLECVRLVNEKLFLNDSGLSIKPKTDILLHKYIGYYLLHNQNIIYNCARGTAQKNLEIDIFKSIQIPIPSIERQEEIVKYLDFIYEKANKTSLSKIQELKQLNEFCLNNQKMFGENVVKTLGELFKLNGNGKTNSKDVSNTGEYPFYRASCENPSGTHNSYDFDGNEYLLIVKSGGSSLKPISREYGIGKVFLVNGKCSANIAVFQLLPKSENNIKYLYKYLLHIQDKIQELAKYCTNNGNIDMNELMNLQIPIPSFERQKEIVEYCEQNDALIKQLEKEIENNKKHANQFIM